MLELAKLHWRCLRDAGPGAAAPFGTKVTRITSGGASYFLKARDTAQDVARDVLIAQACAGESFPVAAPLAAESGVVFVPHEGKCYVLTPELRGAHFSEPSSEDAVLFGRAIAGFQNAVAGLPHDPFPGYEGHYGAQSARLEKLRQAGKNMDAFTVPFDGEKDSRLLTTSLIHRDPHPRNMLFAGGVLTGFLDFDLVKRGPRIFDPCYCATGLLAEGWSDEGKRETWFAALGSIMGGYFETVEPAFDERYHVWAMLLEVQLIFVLWLNEIGKTKEAVLNEEVFLWLAGNRVAIDRAVGAG